MGDANSLEVSSAEDPRMLRRRLAELEASEARFRALFEKGPSMAVTVDSVGKILSVNHHAAEILGYGRSELVGRSVLEIYHPDDRKAVAERLDNCLRFPRRVTEWEMRKIRSDGTVAQVRESGRTIVDPKGDTEVLIVGSTVSASAERPDSGPEPLVTPAQAEEPTAGTTGGIPYTPDLIDAIPAPVFFKDTKGRYLGCNHAYEAITGLTRDELLGKRPSEVASEEVAELHQRHDDLLLREGAEQSYEGRTVDSQGRDRNVIIRKALFKDGNGVPAGIVGVLLDITENKQAEEVLRTSENRYRSLIEDQTELIVRLQPDGTGTFVNDAYCRYFGKTRQELIGSSLFPLIGEEDRGRVQEKLDSLSPQDPVATDERRVLRADGSVSWNEWTDRALFDEENRLIEIQSVGRDITERKQAEDQLQASEARYRLLTDNISDVIWMTDLEGTFTYVSPSVQELLGFSSGELVERRLEEIVAEESLELIRNGLAEATTHAGQTGPDGNRASTVDIQLRHKDGRVVWAQVKMSVLTEDENQATGVLGVARDISAWKDAQEKLRRSEDRLRQAQKMEAIGQLAGGVAHDFNNLLTVIIGNAELLRSELGSEDGRQPRVAEITGAAYRAASLTRQLLAFSRKQLMVPKVVDLNDIVSGTETMLQRIIGEDVELSTRLAADAWRVEADAGQIEQVIMNLAANSRDAMPNGGRLVIETANTELDESFGESRFVVKPGPYVKLSFSDTGTGIDKDDQAKLFEPFFTTKQAGRGTGLGLATVYGIVKQSGGYILVTSEPGRGATFDIYLPRSEKPLEELGARQTDSDSWHGSETVLLVEDEGNVRLLASRILQSYGYRVLEAASGAEALDLCDQASGGIDLLLTDIVMPNMRGDQLVESIAGRFPGMRVLFMTGYTDDTPGRVGDLEPGRNLLLKPFSPDLLAQKVRETLDATSEDRRA